MNTTSSAMTSWFTKMCFNIIFQELERKKNDRVLIPLSIRHFAFVTEEECPITVIVPPRVKPTKDFMKFDIE